MPLRQLLCLADPSLLREGSILQGDRVLFFHGEFELHAGGLLIVFPEVPVILVIVRVVKECDPLLEGGLPAG